MFYGHDRQRAKEIGKHAMSRMDGQRIPVHPNNYAVWYTYQCGGLPGLGKDIEAALADGTIFDETFNTELFNRHFGGAVSSTDLHETSRSIEEAVRGLLSQVGEAGKNSERYGETLEGATGLLTDETSAEQARTVIAGILADTRKMVEENRALQDRINHSTDEISQLRENMQTIRREAMIDGLTGIANRKCFDENIVRLMQESGETGEPLCLLMVDIDHFKKFNDTWGHQIGDLVLKLVARTFTDSVKGRDLPARYGGEEFVLLLPRTDLASAISLADQIRVAIEKKKIVNRSTGESMGNITLSFGAALFREGEAGEALIQRADTALYAAKAAGRNQVVGEDAGPKLANAG